MMWNNGAGCLGGGFPMMMIGGLFMLVFWGLVIWLIILAIRKLSKNEQSNHQSSATDKSVDILRQRYSRGEINAEEYKERLRVLTDENNI